MLEKFTLLEYVPFHADVHLYSVTRLKVDVYNAPTQNNTSGKIKHTIHQVTIMLVTSKNALFPSHNHLLTTGADDNSL